MAAERRRRDVDQTNDLLRAQGMPVRDVPAPELKSEPTSRREARAAYIYEIKVRNAGDKEIASVIWEYVFQEIGSDKEVGRRRFEGKETIARGKTRILVGRSAIPPTGTIDASKLKSKTAEKYAEKIVIVSVVYSDGSRWRSADSN